MMIRSLMGKSTGQHSQVEDMWPQRGSKIVAGSAGKSAMAVIPFLLGQEGTQWMFAADVSSLHTHLKGKSQPTLLFQCPGALFKSLG